MGRVASTFHIMVCADSALQKFCLVLQLTCRVQHIITHYKLNFIFYNTAQVMITDIHTGRLYTLTVYILTTMCVTQIFVPFLLLPVSRIALEFHKPSINFCSKAVCKYGRYANCTHLILVGQSLISRFQIPDGRLNPRSFPQIQDVKIFCLLE